MGARSLVRSGRGAVLAGSLFACAYAGCAGRSVVRGDDGEAGAVAGAGKPGAGGGRGGTGASGGSVASGGRAAAARGGGTSAGRGGAGGAEPAVGGTDSGAAGDGGASGNAGAGGAPLEPLEDLSRDILTTGLVIDTRTREASATITLAPSSSEGASFEIGDLTIHSVEHAGEGLPFADRGARLDVRVPATTEPLTLVIDYRYQHHENLDGVSADGYAITWPDQCGNVFPCHSDWSDGMRFTLELSGGSSLFIHATEISTDAPPYMLAWFEGKFVELGLGETTAGTNVSVFYDSSTTDGESNATLGSASLVAAFDWLETTIGAYAFGSRVGGVSVPWPSQGITGMEHHPFWHVAETSMSDESMQIHEAAHGWFGNGVRLRCWNDFVLSEGTVSYLAARALEEVGSTVSAAELWERYETRVDGYRGRNVSPAWPEGCLRADDGSNISWFSSLTYARGALFFRALEQGIGRPALDRALRAFYQAYVGEAARMQDLLDVVHATSDYDPDACAEAWLRDPVLPEFVSCQ